MRCLLIATLISLVGCTPCPTELPEFADLAEGPTPKIRVGGSWATSFATFGTAECLDVKIEGTSERVPFTLDGTTVHFVAKEPGAYSTTVGLRTRPEDRRLVNTVLAVANPGEIEPCLTIPRSCDSLSNNEVFLACDDTLFTRDGAQVAVVDGGLWHVGDQLFVWADGALRHVTVDGGLVETASIAAPRPAMWDSRDGRVAIWAPDGGALFDLDGTNFVQVAPIVGALHGLAVQPDGGVLRAIAHSPEFVCPLDGACASSSRFVSAAALDGTRLWAIVTGGFRSQVMAFFEQQDGGSWQLSAASGGKPRISVPLPRRLLLSHEWGLQLEGAKKVMRFEEAYRQSASASLVWASSGTETRVWCE